MIFRSKIHWKSVLPCFQSKVCQKCETNFSGQIQTENSSIKNVTNFASPTNFRHQFWCHQYSSHKLAIISRLNVVLSHYLFSTITVIYVLQSLVWLICYESSLYSIYILIIVMNMYLGLLQYTIFFIKNLWLFIFPNE